MLVDDDVDRYAKGASQGHWGCGLYDIKTSGENRARSGFGHNRITSFLSKLQAFNQHRAPKYGPR